MDEIISLYINLLVFSFGKLINYREYQENNFLIVYRYYLNMSFYYETYQKYKEYINEIHNHNTQLKIISSF